MIWEELKESLILTDMEADHWEMILRELGCRMIGEGYACDTYVDALIERERDFPTGIDIQGIGVAIPHTDICHVKKEGIALAVLKHPVKFGQMGEEHLQVEVRIIFLLAVCSPKEHIPRLRNVFDIIQDRRILEQLLTAPGKKEIINIIRDKEKAL